MKRKRPHNTILIVAGGTSGHIYPALAIASAVKEVLPSTKLIFCGVPGSLEQDMVEAEGYDFHPIAAQNMPSRQDRRYWGWLTQNSRGFFMSAAILRKERPRLVIGTGGYVSAPLIAVARFLRVPYILHEQNSVPGRANRMFASGAKTVFISYEASRSHFRKKVQLVLSGNPVRPLFATLDRSKARQALGIAEDIFLILVMGGSLGARTLNRAVAHLDLEGSWSSFMKEHPQVRLATSAGVQSSPACVDELAALPGMLRAEPFFHDAPYWIAACDLFIGRAGAMTCAEIAAQAKPSLLIPFPYAADDHQTANARALEEAGAALVFSDQAFDSQKLLETVEALIQDPDRLARMGEGAGRWAIPDAAGIIAESVLAALEK